MLITFWKCIKKFKQTSVHFIFSFKNNQVQFQMVIILMYFGDRNISVYGICWLFVGILLEKYWKKHLALIHGVEIVYIFSHSCKQV